MCQCVARNDCTVEVANFVYNMDPGACIPAFRAGTISDTKPLTRDVLAFPSSSPNRSISTPGSSWRCRCPACPAIAATRWSTSSAARRRLDFVIKRKPGGGASEWLFNGGAEGAGVELFGPLGAATFYPNLGKNILCIAGGSGIAGMMSILARARQERYFDQFNGYVFFGVRTYRRRVLPGRARRSSRASSRTACT